MEYSRKMLRKPLRINGQKGEPAMPTVSKSDIFRAVSESLNYKFLRHEMWSFIPAALKEDYAAKRQSIRLWLRCIFKALPPDPSGTSLKNFAGLKSVLCGAAVPRRCLMKNLKSCAIVQSEKQLNIYCLMPAMKKSELMEMLLIVRYL